MTTISVVNVVEGVLCYPKCYSTAMFTFTRGAVTACPSKTDMALCGLLAASNLGSLDSYWSCNALGITSADPCMAGWPHITCAGSDILSLSINLPALDGE